MKTVDRERLAGILSALTMILVASVVYVFYLSGFGLFEIFVTLAFLLLIAFVLISGFFFLKEVVFEYFIDLYEGKRR